MARVHERRAAACRSRVLTYTYGHSAPVVDVHRRRTAEVEAGFFRRRLKPGMRVLDAGCGPGSITVGLARAVAPSEVVGVDAEAGVLDGARHLAAGLDNVRFEVGDVSRLPFPDESFDAVLAHAVLEHVADPVAVLREQRRVLRPGGVIGVRDTFWDTGAVSPNPPGLRRAASLYRRAWQANGGWPNCGAHFHRWLTRAGFSEIALSISYRWDGTLESSRSYGQLLADRLLLPNVAGPAIASGWSDRGELERLRDACLAWSRRDDIFATMGMTEAVAVKPSPPSAAG